MLPKAPIDLIDEQTWLEPVADRVKQAVSGTFTAAGEPSRTIKNFLNGTWLGHPLHPVLTDLPIGAWTAAMIFDAHELGAKRRVTSHPADTAIAIGLAGAAAAAVTGLTDWQDIDGRGRRVGLAHGLLNLTGALLFGASLVLRKSGARGLGRGFSLLGYAVALSAAHLGGNLVYGEQIGIDHSKAKNPPADFVPVLDENEIHDDELRRVEKNGMRLLLVKHGGYIHALSEVCSHLGGPLAEGRLEEGSIRCPWHGSRFALGDGRVLDGPATHPQTTFEARVYNGQIEVRARR
jgi:nitrite reductase/ring-hydroxylating ferredoxin subunit/uncharacterized membrane protein